MVAAGVAADHQFVAHAGCQIGPQTKGAIAFKGIDSQLTEISFATT